VSGFWLYFLHIILAEGSDKMKIEADGNDTTELPHYDQPGTGAF